MSKKEIKLLNNRENSLKDYNKYLAYYYKKQKRQKAIARFLLKVLEKANNNYIIYKAIEALNEPIQEVYCTQEQFDGLKKTNK